MEQETSSELDFLLVLQHEKCLHLMHQEMLIGLLMPLELLLLVLLVVQVDISLSLVQDEMVSLLLIYFKQVHI